MTEQLQQPIPPIEIPQARPLDAKESSWFGEGQRLDHKLRYLAGYGALGLAMLMYLFGVAAIWLFMGLSPCLVPRATADMWHIVVAVLIALFSVPTFLLLAVLRSTNLLRKNDQEDSLHGVVGEKVLGALDRMFDKG